MKSFPPSRLFQVIPCTLAVMFLAACSSPREHYAVLPDAAGNTGQMRVTPSAGAPLTLNQDQTSATSRAGKASPTALSQADIKAMYKSALEAQPPAPTQFRLYFVEGSDTLTPESQREIDRVLAEIKQRPAPDLIVIGHTDRVGLVADNDLLALRRAEKISTQLMGQGILAENITATGRGERDPLVVTADEVAEPQNRRVEILVR